MKTLRHYLCARPIIANRAGNRIVAPEEFSLDYPECLILESSASSPENLSPREFLPPPFEAVPLLPPAAVHPGQIIAIVIGPSWKEADRAAGAISQEQDRSLSTESRMIWSSGDALRSSSVDPDEETLRDTHLVQGLYETGEQQHRLDAPLWAEVRTKKDQLHLRIPTQWPDHVRQSLAQALRIPLARISLDVVPVEGGRDGALFFPSLLACLAAQAHRLAQAPLRLALRNDQIALTGGRSPSTVRYLTRVNSTGEILRNEIDIQLDCGAYPTLKEETLSRLHLAAQALYAGPSPHVSARAIRTAYPPLGAFEGVGTAQVSFAREIHYNRLAGIAEEDPILWRKKLFRPEWPLLHNLADTVAENADFHRRYAAHELVRKRRMQLPRNSASLKGIGCAFGEQISGMTSGRERGSVALQLEQDGSARIFCSVPTPTPRLRQAWRAIVARELQIPLEQVTLETRYDEQQDNSGPRIFSRGVSVIPRTLLSACEAVQKQRFREPLPILVRRSIKSSRSKRYPGDALRSLGAAAVEATLIPATMEIDVRSVTMAVYAGTILDRQSAEAELRRGIYQALSWALKEPLDRGARQTNKEAEILGDPEVQRQYTPGFLGAPPRIKVIFVPGGKRDSSVGVGELPFLTVPAALVSALSQASGLYLDGIPARPREVLRMLQEEE
ncbi:CO or xanthine dehydrogenase, Mo-binding subunit [Alkalispirochaeta americana]|uniref:CO or xanthine dehydrogenase, Mo-binding subunit n=1 Tax=Alkalispirochaeta americana TaxID=159291 RepID=A0A1N6WHF6_9SPIO|nr:molybdopterin cofactor-binding domain-containing protein [Alkalispirochaeta americana]SIQ89484.1 CO or xanthine dehydrogenase, Mo-binding subunit [Alkalispirochaeta americana]